MYNPLFSIRIANYKNGQFFEDCYQSILAQTYTNWEAVIVDDCSADDSVAVKEKNRNLFSTVYKLDSKKK